MLEFKPLTLEALPAVMSIEREVFTCPWSAAMMRDSLLAAHCQAWGLWQSQKLIGFGVFTIVLDEAELLNLAVARAQQGQGWGKKLLSLLLEQVRLAKVDKVFLEVRASHQVAQALYFKAGFVKVGSRKEYYPTEHQNKREDAVLMSIQL